MVKNLANDGKMENWRLTSLKIDDESVEYQRKTEYIGCYEKDPQI